MTLVQDLENAEAWVVAEFQKIKAAFQSAETKVVADVEGIFTWIKNHQSQLQAAVQAALEGVSVAGAVVPGVAPLVPGAVVALDAAEAAIDKLAAASVTGSTPLSVLTAAYQATKDAAAAATPLLTTSVAPTPASASAPVTQTPAAS